MFKYNQVSATGFNQQRGMMQVVGSTSLASGSLAAGIGGTSSSSGGGNFTSGGTYLGGVDLSFPLLQDILNIEDQTLLDATYREIYLMDPVSGPVVDMLSLLPWSEYTLSGIQDTKIKEVYESSLEELSIQRLMKMFMTSNYVFGRGIGSLVFNKNRGIFTDCVLYNASEAQIVPIPFIGYDPKINIKLSKDFKKWINSTDKRDLEAKKELSADDIATFSSTGFIELEPLKTIYVERTNLPGVSAVSSYARILPIWLLEKCLLRGTILSATRRQKSILHITMGDADTEYSEEQFQSVAELFANADRDPLGAAVVTRPDVNVNEVRCVHGSTLISTEKGLKRIKELVKHDLESLQGKRTSYPLNIKIKGYDGKFREASEWHYSGFSETIKIKTASGYELICTPEHQIRIFDENGLGWEQAKNIQNKYILIDTQGVHGTSHNTKLKIKLRKKQAWQFSNSYNIPTHMTEDLAYLLGSLLGDGGISCRNGYFATTRLEHFVALNKKFMSVFGQKLKKKIVSYKGNTHTMYVGNFNSVLVVDFFKKLGILPQGNSGKREKLRCRAVKFPKIMYRMPLDCQLAFLAGYLDADGSVRVCKNKTSVEISFVSASKKLIKEMLIFLTDLGFMAKMRSSKTIKWDTTYYHLILEPGSANEFYNMLRPFICINSKRKVKIADESITPARFGIPMKQIGLFYKKRQRQFISGTGKLFETDNGNHVFLRKSPIMSKDRMLNEKAFTPYSKLRHSRLFSCMKDISLSRYNDLKFLEATRPRIEKVVSVKRHKKCHVYDITMKTGMPAFIANGIVIHNSPSDLWSHSAEEAGFTQAKLRAMGVSDSFMSGDATYNNQENTINLMLENLRDQRQELTRSIIRDKIFLSLAKYHNFRKRTKAELSHNIRLSSSSNHAKRDERLYQYAMLTGSRNMADMATYDIPELSWVKDLKPVGSSSDLSLMKELTEAGVPVPASMLSAAAGVDLDQVVSSYKNDLIMRKKIFEYSNAAKKYALKQDDGGGFGMNASASIPPSIEPISLKGKVAIDSLASSIFGKSIELKPAIAKKVEMYVKSLIRGA